MRIIDAISQVLKESKRPLNHLQIYNMIQKHDLYSFGAKDPVSVVRNKLRKHCFGLDFPSASPLKLFLLSSDKSTSRKPLYELYVKHEDSKSVDVSIISSIGISPEQLVEEVIHNNYKKHLFNLKSQLLDIIKSEDPAFFEKLVVDLLLKMGYGWNSTTSGTIVGGSGDEGIDGIISEDKLGLEKIYIQAKRYARNKVPPSEIRDFIGAMALKGAKKGVFFTTSEFTQQAKNHAIDVQGMSITLVDGSLLSELLVQHEMGIAKVENYIVYEVDKNFFADD
jgi:restriction system protein